MEHIHKVSFKKACCVTFTTVKIVQHIWNADRTVVNNTALT